MRAGIIQNAQQEEPGILMNLLAENGWTWETIHAYQKDSSFSNLLNVNLIIILGGPMSVYDEACPPFIKDEIDFIHQALIKRIPMLGICLGAQLIARAAGARVYCAKQREIGWYKVWFTKEGRQNLLFKGFPDMFPVLQWHQDTFDIPEGAIHLIASEPVCNQAFRMEDLVYGLQFHLEVTGEMTQDWLSDSDNEPSLAGISKHQILMEMDSYLPQIQPLARSFFSRFFKQITKIT